MLYSEDCSDGSTIVTDFTVLSFFSPLLGFWAFSTALLMSAMLNGSTYTVSDDGTPLE